MDFDECDFKKTINYLNIDNPYCDQFNRKIDDKGRISLPSDILDIYNERLELIIRKKLEFNLETREELENKKYLYIFSDSDHYRLFDYNPQTLPFHLLSRIKLDNSNRLLISGIREKIPSSNVIIVGEGSSIGIYSPIEYQRLLQQNEKP